LTRNLVVILFNTDTWQDDHMPTTNEASNPERLIANAAWLALLSRISRNLLPGALGLDDIEYDGLVSTIGDYLDAEPLEAGYVDADRDVLMEYVEMHDYDMRAAIQATEI
jgi:hypothetical protein